MKRNNLRKKSLAFYNELELQQIICKSCIWTLIQMCINLSIVQNLNIIKHVIYLKLIFVWRKYFNRLNSNSAGLFCCTNLRTISKMVFYQLLNLQTCSSTFSFFYKPKQNHVLGLRNSIRFKKTKLSKLKALNYQRNRVTVLKPFNTVTESLTSRNCIKSIKHSKPTYLELPFHHFWVTTTLSASEIGKNTWMPIPLPETFFRIKKEKSEKGSEINCHHQKELFFVNADSCVEIHISSLPFH